MDQWRDFPLPDGSYSDGTRPWSQQDICNYLPTYAEQSGTRSRIEYACAPGLATFATVGTGPHRGIHNCEGKLFVVSGESLYQVFVTGNSSLRGTIPGTAPVSMTHNQIDGGNELLIGTGDSSYVYNTKTGQLHQNDNVPLASVDFLNQSMLGVDVGRRFWRYSALADARTWNTLDNESAESSPDLIVGLKVSQGEVAVFGGRTIEIWANDPTQDTAFQRREVIERGCASAKSIQRLDNTLFWQGGDGIVYRLNGYQPVPISPKALTDEFLTCDLENVRSYVHEDKGYVIYYLTFPDGRTWGYDVTASAMAGHPVWHRRQSFGLDRWRLNTLVRWYDGWYGGDFSNGKIYRLTWGYVYEGCELMPRSIRTGVIHNNGNRTFLHGFRLNMQTGGEESTVRGEDPPTISGSLPDGTVGDVVSYQYTITPAFSGQVYSISVTGSLPSGLSISQTGLVTGTLSEAGDFAWTVVVATDCASSQTSDAVLIESPEPTSWAAVSVGKVNGAYALSVGGTDWSAALLEAAPSDSGTAFSTVVLGPDRIALFESSQGKTKVGVGAFADITGLATETINAGLYTGSAFLLACNLSVIQRSTDGLAFTTINTPTVPGHGTDSMLCISQTPSLILACGYWPHLSVNDGVTWTTPTGTFIYTGGAQRAISLANNGLKFIAGGEYGGLASTTAGTGWTQISNPFSNTSAAIRGCAHTNGVWVIGNADGEIAFSSTGLTGEWTLAGSSFGAEIRKIVGRAGLFVAVGVNGTIKTSTDGDSWASATNSFGTSTIGDLSAA